VTEPVTYPRKPRALDDYGEWIAHPRCNHPKAAERLLIENRDDIEVLAEIVDSDSSYSYDEMALVRLASTGALYLLHTSGCSCPSPQETWSVTLEQTTTNAVREMIRSGRYPGATYPEKDVEAFKAQLDAVDKMKFVRVVPGHFDTPPQNAITAEQVRLNTELTNEACEKHCGCLASRLTWVIEQAIKHPGASSSLRAALEAALE
jgi:hypothetical protein